MNDEDGVLWALAKGVMAIAFVFMGLGSLQNCNGLDGGPCAGMTGQQARACHYVHTDGDRNGNLWVP